MKEVGRPPRGGGKITTLQDHRTSELVILYQSKNDPMPVEVGRFSARFQLLLAHPETHITWNWYEFIRTHATNQSRVLR